MNAGILRRPLSLALAAVVCGFALLVSITASIGSPASNSSSAKAVATGSDVTPTGTLNDGFHW